MLIKGQDGDKYDDKPTCRHKDNEPENQWVIMLTWILTISSKDVSKRGEDELLG